MAKLKLLQIREATGESITSPQLAIAMMGEEAKADREAFWVLHLNTKNKVIEKELVALGILDQATIHPREVFKKAILNSACSIMTIHNHPSGDPKPSFEDRQAWERLRKVGEIIGIEVLDNLIVAPSGHYYSEKEGGSQC